MFCPNCGQQLPDGSNFCSLCGTNIADSKRSGIEQVEHGGMASPAGSASARQMPVKKAGAFKMVVDICIVAVVAIIVLFTAKRPLSVLFSAEESQIEWSLSDDFVLTVFGKGKMSDYNSPAETPWSDKVYFTNKIVIESGVTSIGSNAFRDFPLVKSVSIPESVTSIGEWAFYNCSSLTSIDIPESVTKIGDWAFYGCPVTSVTIPSGVTNIGDGTFSGCARLDAIQVADGNEKYITVDGVLFNSEKTKLIVYPAGKTAGFYNIPDSVTSIGDGAFSHCFDLTGVMIPDSVTNIGERVFYGCTCLTSIQVASGNENYISLDGVLFNIDKTDLVAYPTGKAANSYEIPNGVTSIKGCSFVSCSLTSITIPDSVTDIGDDAFKYCGFASITIPESVTSMGDEVFYYCGNLISITIPDGVTSIGNNAFAYCHDLTSITIPDSVTSIGNNAFDCCSSLTSITIPDGVTSIGDDAFLNCENLSSIMIADSVTYIGDRAFKLCGKLSSISIPEGVTRIGNDAFLRCESLTSITIPESVTSIGDSAFSNCKNLSDITIPGGVVSIGNDVFSGCSNLTAIQVAHVNESYKSINGILFNTAKKELVAYPAGKTDDVYIVPDGVISIGDNAFIGCRYLTSITIPDSVTSIREWAFAYCSNLTGITIPNSVTDIGKNAFFSGRDDIIIYGRAGSTAEAYAKENGHTFQAIY